MAEPARTHPGRPLTEVKACATEPSAPAVPHQHRSASNRRVPAPRDALLPADSCGHRGTSAGAREVIDTCAAGANDEGVSRSVDGSTSTGADDAAAPAKLSAQSWRQLLQRAVRHAVDARLPFLSAGLAFFAVLSVAP